MFMDKSPPRRSPSENVAAILFVGSMLFCATEKAPDWGWFGVGWPDGVYYGIMVVAGGVAGVLTTERYRVPGAIGGILSGVGGFFILSRILVTGHSLPKLGVILVILVGCGPGFVVGWLLTKVQDYIAPPEVLTLAEEDLLDDPS